MAGSSRPEVADAEGSKRAFHPSSGTANGPQATEGRATVWAYEVAAPLRGNITEGRGKKGGRFELTCVAVRSVFLHTSDVYSLFPTGCPGQRSRPCRIAKRDDGQVTWPELALSINVKGGEVRKDT